MYVQDRLREAGRQIWTLLEAGAHFYVCGDAAHMAAAVEEALLEVIMRHQVRTLCLLFCLLWHATSCSVHGRFYCFAGRGQARRQ